MAADPGAKNEVVRTVLTAYEVDKWYTNILMYPLHRLFFFQTFFDLGFYVIFSCRLGITLGQTSWSACIREFTRAKRVQVHHRCIEIIRGLTYHLVTISGSLPLNNPSVNSLMHVIPELS